MDSAPRLGTGSPPCPTWSPTTPRPTGRPPATSTRSSAPTACPRAHAVSLAAEIARARPELLTAAGHRRDAIFVQQGITFDATGEDGPGQRPPVPARPRPADPARRRVGPHRARPGPAHPRAEPLHRRRLPRARDRPRAGIVPWRLIVSRSHFARAAHGVRPPGGVYCHVAGCDLVRDGDGSWKVLEDNVRTPSGISYVLENRVAMTRLVPQLFQHHRVRPVDHYPQLLLAGLRSVAPSAEDEATVVVWTPGPHELRLLRARVPRAPDGRRAGRGVRPRRPRRRPLHAHDRRAASGCTPSTAASTTTSSTRWSSARTPCSACPGLVRAYRAGTVAIANALRHRRRRRQGRSTTTCRR